MKKGFHPVWIKWVKRSIEMDTLLSISMGSKGLSFVLIGESDKGTLCPLCCLTLWFKLCLQ
jgi:hypothetical protein